MNEAIFILFINFFLYNDIQIHMQHTPQVTNNKKVRS